MFFWGHTSSRWQAVRPILLTLPEKSRWRTFWRRLALKGHHWRETSFKLNAIIKHRRESREGLSTIFQLSKNKFSNGLHMKKSFFGLKNGPKWSFYLLQAENSTVNLENVRLQKRATNFAEDEYESLIHFEDEKYNRIRRVHWSDFVFIA